MAYSIAHREHALDFMEGWPEYGEQRWYSDALGTEQVSFSWRRMLPDTGGRGSYGHRHPGQEEIYFVVAGTVPFKTGDEFYSLHNDTDAEAQLVIFSTRLAEAPFDKQDGFWP